MLENYHEPEELLSDESFLNWYFKTGTRKDPGQEKEWEIWMAGEPARRELVEQAIKLLDTTRIPEKELPAGQINAAESMLMNRISGTRGIPSIPSDRTAHASIGNRRVWAAAAVLLVLVVSGWLLRHSLFTGRSEIRTEYGQIMQRQLPDGTEVTLDANTRLSWSIAQQDGADREVWVRGEAFFHVHKTPLKSRFIVHTDHFDIQVLGTQFNVVNRPAQDNVLLSEGSVMLQTSEGGKLKMVPGDFVQFNAGQLEKLAAQDDSLTAWKEHKLKLNNTPLRTLAAIITEQYGVEVKLEDDATGDKTISGILSNNNLDVLLRALELTEKFDVTRKDGIILIKGH
jgi:transmembrane sensor